MGCWVSSLHKFIFLSEFKNKYFSDSQLNPVKVLHNRTRLKGILETDLVDKNYLVCAELSERNELN